LIKFNYLFQIEQQKREKRADVSDSRAPSNSHFPGAQQDRYLPQGSKPIDRQVQYQPQQSMPEPVNRAPARERVDFQSPEDMEKLRRKQSQVTISNCSRIGLFYI
jgi:hypothetical protein